MKTAYAYVDGSFNPKSKVYSYGIVLVTNGETHTFGGCDNKPEMVGMRNVAGEICGATEAIQIAINMGIDEIDIYYDYAGIEFWATGVWKRNTVGTMAYHQFIKKCKTKIKVKFHKVKAHSGVPENELADKLAKRYAGIP